MGMFLSFPKSCENRDIAPLKAVREVKLIWHQNQSAKEVITVFIYLYSTISKVPYSALQNKPNRLTIYMAYRNKYQNS